MKGNLAVAIVIIIVAFLVGRHFGIGNQYVRYSDAGSPKNCRALIAINIYGHSTGLYTAEEALNSIDRNCGLDGYIWNQR